MGRRVQIPSLLIEHGISASISPPPSSALPIFPAFSSFSLPEHGNGNLPPTLRIYYFRIPHVHLSPSPATPSYYRSLYPISYLVFPSCISFPCICRYCATRVTSYSYHTSSSLLHTLPFSDEHACFLCCIVCPVLLLTLVAFLFHAVRTWPLHICKSCALRFTIS